MNVAKTTEKIIQENGWDFIDYFSEEELVIYKKDKFRIGFNLETKEIELTVYPLDKFSVEEMIKFGEELKKIVAKEGDKNERNN